MITAVLSTGPVGFGDLINGTNLTLLGRGTRVDGTIIKPASAALRAERFYGSGGGAEIWVAPSGPAGGIDPRTDARANSMAPLGTLAGRALAGNEYGAGGSTTVEEQIVRGGTGGTGGTGVNGVADMKGMNDMKGTKDIKDLATGDLWWWNVLATNVDGGTVAGRPLTVDELWPTPAPGTVLLVSTVARSGEGVANTKGKTGRLPTTSNSSKRASTFVAAAAAAAAVEAVEAVAPTTTTGGQRACINGTAVEECLTVWDAHTPLPIGTVGEDTGQASLNSPKYTCGHPQAHPPARHNYTLLAAAPVLSSGWALIGDLTKFVPCSPQRFVAPSSRAAPRDSDMAARTVARTVAGGNGSFVAAAAAGLQFTVIGTEGEQLFVTVVVPPTRTTLDETQTRRSARGAQGSERSSVGTILVVDVLLGASGQADVTCAGVRCDVTML